MKRYTVSSGHSFQQAVHDQKECFAYFRQSAFGIPHALYLMGAGLVSIRVNARKDRNGVSVCEMGHIPKLRSYAGGQVNLPHRARP